MTLPKGYRFAGVHCQIKSDPAKEDLSLIVSDRPATAAGVYTQNKVFAAPVAFDRQRTPSDSIRCVVANSGNANACTGEQGFKDTERMAKIAAEQCGADPQQTLVLSTGIIGQFLPMGKIETGIRSAADQLATSDEALIRAARGIMTTDTVHKLASRSLDLEERTIRLSGMAKGAAMIGPNMATMLGIVLTDAALGPDDAQRMLTAAVNGSFNCISVEGHMSTNDTVLLLANGAAGGEPLSGDDLKRFEQALDEICAELARKIPADGEGASHLITIDVNGCQTTEDARRIAKTVANSALVKTAVTGADPNWGRIVSAAGYAGVAFDPLGVRLTLNGFLLYEQGAPVEFDEAAVSESIRTERDTSIVLQLTEGPHDARFWTTDLTAEYVRLNADYHT